MPSSPYGPCNTGSTASTWPSEVSVPSSSRAKKPSWPSATSSTTSLEESVFSTIGRPSLMFHLRGSSPSTIHSPFLVIPTSMASNLSVSNARSTPAAEMQEIECSSALPPYITTMRCFAIFVLCSISWSVERTRAQHRLPILSVLSVFAISRRFALLFARDTTHSQYRSSVYKPHPTATRDEP